MNNAVYGKTIENLRNTIIVKLVNNDKNYLKCTSNPCYMSRKIFDNNLELSKVLMHEFHYDYIKNTYDNKGKLLFAHTDKLCMK